ncbi:MAG TPA: hypothetical protein VMR44_09560 [Thermoanaerobaculia bacterium]|nr:hypothetical protein [Thermoanaerobaculia bacterium]
MLHKLIEGVQIDVGPELAREIPDGQAPLGRSLEKRLLLRQAVEVSLTCPPQAAVGGRVLKEDQVYQPQNRRFPLLGRQPLPKNPPVECHEEAPDIELEVEGPAGGVGGGLAGERAQALDPGQRPLALATGKRVVDEAPLPTRLQIPHQHMVHHPVAEVGGEDLAPLRLLQQEGQKPARPIGAGLQLSVKIDQVLFQLVRQPVRVCPPSVGNRGGRDGRTMVKRGLARAVFSARPVLAVPRLP